MAMNYKWIPEFQKYLKDFEKKYQLSQSRLSHLGYALSEGILPMDDYLIWAQKNYQMPILQNDFFNAFLPSTEDWKTWKSDFAWNEEIVPLNLWDGHLLIACIEMPTNVPSSLYPIFLLTDIKNIKRTLEFYKNTEKGEESAKKIKEIISSSPNNTNSKLSQLKINKQNVNTSDDLLVLKEIPESNESSNKPTENSPNSEEIQILEGLHPESSRKNKNDTLSFDSIDFNLNKSSEGVPLKFTQVEISNSSSTKKNESESESEMLFSEQTKASIAVFSNSEILPSKIQKEIDSGLPYLIAFKKFNPSQFENITQDFFQKKSNLFGKYILIAIDGAESLGVPVSWTDSIIPRSKEIDKVDLTVPSIFKIVASSLKSYHGHIVLNEANEKFFEFWNRGEVPGCITMTPLIHNNKLIGLLMGLGETINYNWPTLRAMELGAKEFSSTLSHMWDAQKTA